MSARKNRPMRGDDFTPDMSQRDMAAALGVSTAEQWRWQRLAEIPEDEFERRIATLKEANEITTTAMLRGAPAPARGRVERAKGIVGAMTSDELAVFFVWIVSEAESCLRP